MTDHDIFLKVSQDLNFGAIKCTVCGKIIIESKDIPLISEFNKKDTYEKIRPHFDESGSCK